MGYDVWKTLYTNDFDPAKYLYHYTNIEKAIKIIHSQELRFSSITNTNDTSEAKLKILFTDSSNNEISLMDDRVKRVDEYFKKYHDVVRLLCFSMDTSLSKKEKTAAAVLHKNHAKDKYFDVSGRGFALPRMWAQYADNNAGVCLIINKACLEDQLRNRIEFFKCSKVVYKGFFDVYKIDEAKLNELSKKIEMVANGGLTLVNLMQKDKVFLQYNFFEKLNDWQNEHEYRYLALTDKPENMITVKNLFQFVEGIVIGEKIDPAYEEAIRKLVDKRCDIKKIFFENRACRVK